MRARTFIALLLSSLFAVPSIGYASSATVTDISNPDAYTCSQPGYVDFENFPDGFNLSPNAINGIHFTTTGGYSWLVADMATGNYNGKYPHGIYMGQGTHVAWLGTNQGAGRIDFVNGPASYISLLTSNATPMYLDAYDATGKLLATAGPAPSNVTTGHMGELKIIRDTADISYVIVHDSGNFFVVDSICTNAPGTSSGASSVLFLPGTEASRLYTHNPSGQDINLWEPTLTSSIDALALDPNGNSKGLIFTKDIIDCALCSTLHIEVYGQFEKFMDSLVANGTIREWRAYPYDWRFDVFDIVNNGTLTEQPDKSLKQVYLIDTLKQMAANSPTGKVTIVAHSNGGLLAKALAITLGADAPKYIDKIIMIGTPQWGTPSAINALEHSDNINGIEELFISKLAARSAAITMPGAYSLIPTPTYLSRILDPIVTFAPGAISGKFADAYGSSISTTPALDNFLTDSASLDSLAGNENPIDNPVPLPTSLLAKEAGTHAALDAWQPPPNIKVTSIAGWGQLTKKTIAYSTRKELQCSLVGVFCSNVSVLSRSPIVTQDGDDTVVSPSAIGEIGQQFYFNAKAFQASSGVNIFHQNLTQATPIQQSISNLIKSESINQQDITSTKPPGGLSPITVISTHSPVQFTVTDSSGNVSGVLPVPGTDFLDRVQNIPGSSVIMLGSEEYVYVPTNGSYTVSMQAYGSGSATLDIGPLLPDGSLSTSQEFANVPLTPQTVINFVVSNGSANSPAVDEEGNGTVDFNLVANSPFVIPQDQVVSYLRAYVGSHLSDKGTQQDLYTALSMIARANDATDPQQAIKVFENKISAQLNIHIDQSTALVLLQIVSTLQ